ncbi:hypothetical protein GCM10010909_05660 [Acidocella aquatica]|uniref:Methyltransferase FkbM domain-containing protein n=1 Tax=Acidocella aquatica TaxID=1922313 RepID=A0ABQ6A2P8_9PROT|nr:FkbM family methyltransferase [Acidocella aquatica]GLR65888.1 hypothetical protein GCM10010909_05660 [Acidocella aquatica]
MKQFYKFRLTIGYLAHLYKSVTRQDHSHLKPIIRRYLPLNGVAIDVGAHGGQITRLLAGLAPDGFVVAVEPSGYTRSILRAALWLRRCTNTVVFAAALGSNFGTMLIRTPLKRRGDMGYGLANLIEGGANSICEPVALVTLDSLAEQLALTRVDFIKADIEGFEAELIRGAHHVLKTFRPAVYLEMNDEFLRRAGSSRAALWGELLALGFNPHDAAGENPQPLPVTASDEDVLWLPA